MIARDGAGASFEANWTSQPEAHYLHWTRGRPANQIQLAFRQHWLLFQEIIEGSPPRPSCLEVGCGRGSLSAYFADAGWNCTLLDIAPTAIELARRAFSDIGLAAQFDVGDCLNLPYENDTFDAVFSIGLLEHFEEVETAIAEQVRVLAPAGTFIGYVVPQLTDSVQEKYNWMCDLLKALLPTNSAAAKSDVYRSDAPSPGYLTAMERAGLIDRQAIGTYPLPMISHSIEFPFSLLPASAEAVLVERFEEMLEQRQRDDPSRHPWTCDEGYGQAFLVWGTKPHVER